ncbi:hypothetical protein [Natrarchaeobaculum sulfurireducens]|uniref:Uncharacterized protein n=1 Tax=Natrarchaeobaculum sulfurireducens TaxID=2044521 RepID=A0A346PME8_9EURY|nr:hypothetical protein [Natrarchaeobaculum sulfurireducens]AXR80693.1 hypothetical protein AArcMg_0671 [Natrarchaeobaculum sulfurireducens]
MTTCTQTSDDEQTTELPDAPALQVLYETWETTADGDMYALAAIDGEWECWVISAEDAESLPDRYRLDDGGIYWGLIASDEHDFDLLDALVLDDGPELDAETLHSEVPTAFPWH